jgi:hypothetical protein
MLIALTQVEIRNTVNAWIIVALVLGTAVVLFLLLGLFRTLRKHDETVESITEARALTRLPEHVSTEVWFAAAEQSQRASDRRRHR